MSDIDLVISNGTCYFATNRKAADTFIPCGNAANAAYTCCLKGDVCLEGSVCFHPDGMRGHDLHSGMYGSGLWERRWGLPPQGKVRRPTDSRPGAVPGLGRWLQARRAMGRLPRRQRQNRDDGVPSPCSCSDPDYQGLFRQKPTIEAVATLPTALGQTILFAKDHEPSLLFAKSSPPRAGSSSIVPPRYTTIIISVPTTRPSSVIVTNAPSTSSAAFLTDVTVSAKDTSTPDQEGLSAGAKAGIAVGVILAVLLSSAIFFLAATMRRRHHRASTGGGAAAGAEAEAEAAAKAPLTTDGPVAPTREPLAAAAVAAPPPPSWNNSPDPAAAPAASMFRDAAGPGHRAEEWFKPGLAADESTAIVSSSSSSPDPAALLVAGGGVQTGYFDSKNSPPPLSEHHASSGMRDSRRSSVSDPSSYSGSFRQARRSPFPVTPQHASSGSRAKPLESISELQG
ncbi:hypothetical protein PG997_008543 [Apiospora hydei]|uniref:Uncharacterized protein n=1 Tax=Apiospora hydei TaxID=1337664 RepID=A0ABR1WB52_9PEZI